MVYWVASCDILHGSSNSRASWEAAAGTIPKAMSTLRFWTPPRSHSTIHLAFLQEKFHGPQKVESDHHDRGAHVGWGEEMKCHGSHDSHSLRNLFAGIMWSYLRHGLMIQLK